jgi:hypothetical protein
MFKLLSLSLFSISAVSPFLIASFTPKAMAACVAVDTGVQVAVDRSRERRQTNDVSQNFDENCNGSVRSRGTQVCNSDGVCEQVRRSDQTVTGDSNRRSRGPNIGVKVHVPVHVTKPDVGR